MFGKEEVILQWLYCLLVAGMWFLLWETFFSWIHPRKWIYDYFKRLYENWTASTTDVFKKELFEPLHELESSNVVIRNKGLLRILEVGVGTGSNLQYLPRNSLVTIVEDDSKMEKKFRENMMEHQHLQYEKFVISSTSDMKEIASNFYDAVICTSVMCRVPDLDRFLKEVYRVLAPGKGLYFMEHDVDKSDRWRRLFQNWVDATRLWSAVNRNCRLSRDLLPSMEKIFSLVCCYRFSLSYRKEYSPINIGVYLMKSHIYGVAYKAEVPEPNP